MFALNLKSDALATEVYAVEDWPAHATSWARLAEQSSHATFFVSREWIETWLESFGYALKPSILVVRDDREPVGMCLLVRRTVRRGPFTIRRIFLNARGEDDRDSACTEFDTVLCAPGYEKAVASALRDHLARQHAPWDEVHLPAAVEGTMLEALRESFGSLHELESSKPSHYVDLADVRASGTDYVQSLPSRMRTQFRQSAKHYAKLGELRLEIAETELRAQQLLTELAELHQASWTTRGEAGSFASPLFFQFHRRLIKRCFDRGSIQLLRVRAGDKTIGAMYNFVDRGKVFFYQSGLDYGLDKKLSPGLVVHVFAIRHAVEAGLSEYDLMAGDVDYKRKLAPKSRTLHWLVWRATSVKMRTFDLLRDTKHWVETRPLAEARSLVTSFRSLITTRS